MAGQRAAQAETKLTNTMACPGPQQSRCTSTLVGGRTPAGGRPLFIQKTRSDLTVEWAEEAATGK